MLTARIYRPALSFDQAMSRVNGLAGTQLDPVLVTAFSELAHAGWWEDLRQASLRQAQTAEEVWRRSLSES